MLISVITVAFNAIDALKRTIASVVSQKDAEFEYIVVDGAGNDGTAAYLESGISGVSRWISEPDGGIYEAMNKGVRLACGDYCIFMNAGDVFANVHVLSRISPKLEGADIVLGNELLVNGKGRITGFTPSRGGFSTDNLLHYSVCHQASFIRRDILLDHPYDESLRLVSDWKFILERFLSGENSFKTVNIDVCLFFAGGLTDKHYDYGQKERLIVLNGYPEYACIWKSKPPKRTARRIWNHLIMLVKRSYYTRLHNL